MYTVTKRYGHERGFTTAFRQHKAKSHCRHIHGYSLSFEFELMCDKLSPEGWVVDFSSFKRLENALHREFDHTYWAHLDDPQREQIEALQKADMIDVRWSKESPCCEIFAKIAYRLCQVIIEDNKERGLTCLSVTVHEHGSNSVTYLPEGVDDED